MSWLEDKYIGIVSSRLRNFKRKGQGRYTFSCPICGDSEKDRKKARGNIYLKGGNLRYHCFNCSTSSSIPSLIKAIDESIYSEYSIEKLRDEKGGFNTTPAAEFAMKMKPPVFRKSGPLKGVKKVSQLEVNHPAKKFVDSRRIPTPYHAKLFYVPNFYGWANEIVPKKFSEDSLKRDEGRLVIPFLNKDGELHAFQGRSLDPKDKVRYITVVADDTQPKLYGLDTVDLSRTTYVMEGPIDSMFIPNSVATAGGDLVSALSPIQSSKTSLVIVYDNEPRSSDTVKKLDKAIMQGYSVCVWPDNLEHKDVNDMVMAGLTSEFIRYIIDQNTFRDLKAKLALQRWRKA